MAAVVINTMGKRKKEHDDNDSSNKKARVVWTETLHAKFVAAVKKLGQKDAVPRRIAALMNVDGITTKHVASHLQKYRLGNNKKAIHHQDDKLPSSTSTLTQSQNIPSTLITQSQNINILNKKAIHHHQPHKVPSTLITQSQNINIHPSYNFPPLNPTSTVLLPNKKPVHQSHTQFYSSAGLNMCGVTPSTLTQPIQSQNINNTSLNIHPPPSTFPTHSQNIINNSYNIHPLYDFPPVNQTSTLLRKKKVVHQSDTQIYSLAGFNMTEVAPSPLIHPTQSQNMNTHPSYNFPVKQTSTLLLPNNMPLHQSHPLPNPDIYSPTAFNISGLTPSTLIPRPTQSQNINIHPSYNFPVKQTSTLLLPNKIPVHQSDTTLPNPEIYSPTGFNMSGVTPSTLLRQPTQSQNINDSSSIIHPPPSTFPIYHNTSTFPTLVNQSETPLGFAATTFDFHDVGTFVGSSSSSKSTSIWDYDWHQKFMKRKPESLQFSHNSLPVLESDKTSQMNNSQQTHDNVEPFILGSASSKSTSIWDYDWYKKYGKREPQLLQFPHNSFRVLESDKTSQNSQMNSQQTEPFMDGFASSLEDTNIDISDYNLCSENSPIDFSVEETDPNTLEDIDFSVEETDPNTLEDIRNMGRCIEDEDLINAWRCFQEEEATNVMQQP